MPLRTIDLLIEELHVSVQELSNRCGIATSRLEAITSGRWTPSPQDRQKIAAALGVSAEEISWGHTMNVRNVRYHRFGLKEDF